VIAIVDYGAGNVTSVKKALNFVGAETVVTGSADALKSAEKIVLPVRRFSGFAWGCNGSSRAARNLRMLQERR
jgi:imidazoleglycerol phosphate synthase glutamine amidotransferase subunit HisH